ncbi:putative Ig domain-containing protein [Kitasatospora aureofaciens]|uniref:putative Ig domain-containing protein n=1 Tax=Kitasatospora aureofaciens TaxID=1894 RepID=UPI000996AC9A|nr:putative Ig domain-containing protein [Kitasatospora aureofaciens]
MFKRLVAVAGTSAVVAGGLALAAVPAHAVQAADLTSTIALDDCSASLVRFPASVAGDRAMMLTNGHCLPTMPPYGQVIQNVSASRSGTLLDGAGNSLGTVQADKVIYATMTGTDVALYELTDTYGSISSKYGATALTVNDAHPTDGASMYIPSSYWKQVWNCSVNGFVPTLREDQWTWHDSLRYSSGCNTTHGTSGSPIIDSASGRIVGINNTGNDDGEMCTLNNPCEVAADGSTTATKGQSYGEETYWFTTCLNSSRAIDLTVPGCLLTKPAGAAVSVASPGDQSTAVGGAVSLQINASGGTAPLSYRASGLPAGLSINSSTGLISGTVSTAGSSTVTVTVTDAAGKSATTSFGWTVAGSGGGSCTPAQLLGNPGFETGSAAPWTASSGVVDNSSSEAAHGGSWKAYLDGYGSSHTDTLSQTVTVPAGCKATLSFWLHIDTAETGSTAYDKLTVSVNEGPAASAAGPCCLLRLRSSPCTCRTAFRSRRRTSRRRITDRIGAAIC